MQRHRETRPRPCPCQWSRWIQSCRPPARDTESWKTHPGLIKPTRNSGRPASLAIGRNKGMNARPGGAFTAGAPTWIAANPFPMTKGPSTARPPTFQGPNAPDRCRMPASEEVVLARMLPCASATAMVRKKQARQRLIQRRLYGRSIRNISAQHWRYCQSIQRHFARIQRARGTWSSITLASKIR